MNNQTVAGTPPITAPSESPLSDAPFVSQPTTVEETGLELSLLVDMMLKTVYFLGRPSARALCEQLALSFSVLEELVTFLRQEQALEIVGSSGLGEQAYQYALTERGRHKAEEALQRSHYVGPAPIPFELYTDVLSRQSAHDIRIDTETYLEGLAHLVLPRRVLAGLGPALNSGRSLLVYGGAGNGKSSITVAVGDMLPGEVLIPHAVVVHGQIIKVFDPRMHHRISDEILEERRKNAARFSPTGRERRQDPRWAIAKRPVVSVGGELSLKDLEMRYSSTSNFYIAPLQWKANSGVLIIDDFGRQRMRAAELLNRWIVPLEKGVDNLTLHTGVKFPVPFDCILIFATNLNPRDLVDEAFLRRIRFKVEVKSPSRAAYEGIFKMNCDLEGIDYDPAAVELLFSEYYDPMGFSPRGCHPRDLLHHIQTMAKFGDVEPNLGKEFLHRAARSYFLVVEEEYQGGVPSIKSGGHA